MKKISQSALILRVIYFLLGAILFLVPIFFAPTLLTPFLATKTFLFLFLTELAAFFYLYLIFISPEHRPKKSYVMYSLLAFVVISILSGIAGPSPAASFWSDSIRFDGTLVLAHVFVFFLVIAHTVRLKKVLHAFIWTSVVSSVVVSGSIYLVYLNVLGKNLFSGGGGLMSNDSYAAPYLLFNLFFIFYLLINSQYRYQRYILEFFIVFMLLSPTFFNFDIYKGLVSGNDILHHPTLLLGTARGAIMGLVLGGILTTLLLFTRNSKKIIRNVAKVAVGSFLATIVVVCVLISVSGTNLHAWFKNETGGFRLIYWHQAIEGIRDRPILGWGQGNFILVNEKYYDSSVLDRDYEGTETYSDKAHNIILDTLVTTGVLGFLAYACIFVFALRLLWRSKNITLYSKSLFTGLTLGYVLLNLVFFDVLVSYIMFIFLLATIVILDRGSDEEQVSVVQHKNEHAIYLVVAMLLVASVFSVRYFVYLPLKEAYIAQRYYDLPYTVRGYYTGRMEFSNFGTSRDAEKHALFIFREYLGRMNSIKGQGAYEPYIRDINNTISVIVMNSGSTGLTFWGVNQIFQLSDIKYQLTEEKALLPVMRTLSEKEIALSPNNTRGYIDNARVFFLEGRYAETINVLENALQISSKNIRIHNIIIAVARTVGDENLIDQKIKEANEAVPGFGFQ